MSAMQNTLTRRLVRSLPWAAALILLFWAVAPAFAQDEADPPGRVALVGAREGSVVFAPQGESEWTELQQNRPLTTGDRIWTDRGARAELQLGAATVHLGNEGHLGLSDLDERSARFLLQQGSLQARVRELAQGENFEVGTPHLALRALQPGDFRIDVTPDGRETRVAVRSGAAQVFGEGGQTLHLGPGQVLAFAGRALAQVPASRAQDDFAAWADQRNRLEDQSIAARHLPRGVVGATQLDAHGSWSQDPALGAVWYPRVTVQDWAPYRYGNWEWIQPWGWTWIDDAPWGFAPFHYGRWTMLGSRWAWVPGPLAARPVYAPALVVFAGGDGASFSVGGPAVAWYPLAPGEAWWPWYRTSPRYVSFANHNINLGAFPRHYRDHVWRHRPHAITSVREDDFRRGRRVDRNWQAVPPRAIDRAQFGVAPARPDGRRDREGDRGRNEGRRTDPRPQFAPPTVLQPTAPRAWSRPEAPPAVRDQYRAQREQDRLQRDAERDAWRQQRQGEGARDDGLRRQREEMQRQQGAGARLQEEARRQQQEIRQRHEGQLNENLQRHREATQPHRPSGNVHDAWRR